MNHYDELEVSTSASTEVIKAAYKAQAKKYHPDIYRGDPRFASEKLINLNNAYDVLTNPRKREEYDYLNKIYSKNRKTYSEPNYQSNNKSKEEYKSSTAYSHNNKSTSDRNKTDLDDNDFIGLPFFSFGMIIVFLFLLYTFFQ